MNNLTEDNTINEKNKTDIVRRIKWVRKSLLGVSMEKLAEIANINRATIENWERGKIDFLTSISMNNIINVFEAAGMCVSEQWLRTGVGDAPCRFENLTNRESFVLEEENLFEKHQKLFGLDTSIVNASDDAMAPAIKRGTRVGGIIYKDNFQEHDGEQCIIKYLDEKNKEIWTVRILRAKSDSSFLLIPYDQGKQNQYKEVQVSTEKICFVAPICRTWKY